MLLLQTWLMVQAAGLRDRAADVLRSRSEKGADTVEYVVLAVGMAAVAVVLIGIISGKVTNLGNSIKG